MKAAAIDLDRLRLDRRRPDPAPAAVPVQKTATTEAVKGRGLLSSGEEFSCLAHNVTTQSADIVANVNVHQGQVLVCHLDEIGLLPGKIASVSEERFKVNFILKGERLRRLAAQIEWLVTQSSRQADLRRSPRIVPLHKATEVRLGEHLVRTGTILNISMSGAAIALEAAATPFVGARVRVGKRYATVVRLIEGGIAVEFLTPFTPDNFDERVRP